MTPMVSGNHGVLLRDRGELGEAERLFRPVTEAGDADAANDLVRLLAERGDFDEAESWLRRSAAAGNPVTVGNLRNLRSERKRRWWRRR